MFLQSVSAYSGHYRPTDENLSVFLAFLKNNGVNLELVKVKFSYSSYHASRRCVNLCNVFQIFHFRQVNFYRELHQNENVNKSAYECNRGAMRRHIKNHLVYSRSNVV